MNQNTWRILASRLRFYYEDLCSEISNRDWRIPPKPWSEFIHRFTFPKPQLRSIGNRAVLNSHLYQTNYCIILGAAVLYYVLRRPSSLFLVMCIVTGWVYATSPKPLIINGRRITRHQRFATVCGLSTILLVISGVLLAFLKVLSVAIAFVVLHACLRHTSLRQKVGEIRTHMADKW